jgi:tRNA U55 pseudouridine synthase TruB
MSSLVRTNAGGFDISDSHTTEELSSLGEDRLLSLLRPTEELFLEYPILRLDDFFYKLCYSGCEIYQKKINTSYPVGQYLRLYSKDGFFGLGCVREYENGTAVKCEKLFVL